MNVEHTPAPGDRATPDFGYDAPYALIMFTVVGLLFTVFAIAMAWRQLPRAALVPAAYAAFFLANALSFFYTTRHGKLRVWSDILDGLRLRGDERVLDMGCGRGAVLTAVAGRLTRGQVVGIDLWSTTDQSGNARDVTLHNAAACGIQDRVSIETGDMRALPFANDTFDVVVSRLAIHNISGRAERAKAIAEAYRVVKPGGRLVIADIRATRSYAEGLQSLGAAAVERRNLGWRFWYGNPFAATQLVTAQKPARQG